MKQNLLMRRMLSLCLVFVMIWGMLPDASAMEPICGLTEHKHDESCYAVYGDDVLKCSAGTYLHKHDSSCYGSDGSLVCYKTDYYLHLHSAEQGCYDSENNLICELPEYDESIHELDYASNDNITCVYAPRFEHVHNSACYETVKVLTCEQDTSVVVHEHDDCCYTRELTCDISEDVSEETDIPEVSEPENPEIQNSEPEAPENSESSESPDIGIPEPNPIPDPEPVPAPDPESEPDSSLSGDELALAHVHDDSCYTQVLTCDISQYHEHDDACYDISEKLVCDYESGNNSNNNIAPDVTICHHWQYELHTHSSDCYDKNMNVICGKYEIKSHVHNSTCFDREILSYDSEVLTCNQDEHVHSVSCYFKDKTEELDAFLTAYDKFSSDINAGVYDLSSDNGIESAAMAAYQVLELSKKLDRDVLDLASVKSMLEFLNLYIPEGFTGLGGPYPDLSDSFDTPIGYAKIPIEIQAPYGFDLSQAKVSFDISVVNFGYFDSDTWVRASDDWIAKYTTWLRGGEFFKETYDINDIESLRVPIFYDGWYEFRIRMTYADAGNMGCIVDARDMFLDAKFDSNSHAAGVDEFVQWNVYYYDDNARQEFNPDGSVNESYRYRDNYSDSENVVAHDYDDTSTGIPFMVRPNSMSIQDATSFSSESLRLAKRYMANLTDDEKIGQLLLMHFSANANIGSDYDYAKLISDYHVGGLILFDADTQPRDPASLTALIKSAQDKSKIPMIISVDEEGGRRSDNTLINRVSNHSQYGHAPFVSPRELYASGGYDGIKNDSIDKASFLKRFGFNVNHAPVADLAKDGYVSGRSFGSDAIGTSQYVWNVVSGHESNQVGSTMKHFPGYGNTSSNTHNGFAVNDLKEEMFLYRELIPFYSGMLAGGKAIMVTHNAINYLDEENCASCSPAVYKLARDMGFSGVCMTDDLNMGAVINKYGSGAVQALKAGADIALTGNGSDAAALFNAVKSGELSMREIEEKCLRVLAWKAELGLLDNSNLPEVPGDDSQTVEYTSPDGQTEITSFDSGIEKANAAGGTVKLIADVSVDDNIRISDKRITLDLNGHTLDILGDRGFVVANSQDAYFEITDTSYDRNSILIRNFVETGPDIFGSNGQRVSAEEAYSRLTDFDDSTSKAFWYSVKLLDDADADIISVSDIESEGEEGVESGEIESGEPESGEIESGEPESGSPEFGETESGGDVDGGSVEFVPDEILSGVPAYDISPVKYDLNLGSVGRIRMDFALGSLISYESGYASCVNFSGGYIQSNTSNYVVDMQYAGNGSKLDVSGGWFYRCDANSIVRGGRNDYCSINLSDGGFVGNNCSDSVISNRFANLTLSGSVFGGNYVNNSVISVSGGNAINARQFDFGSNVCAGSSGSVICAKVDSFASSDSTLGNLIFGYNFNAHDGGAMYIDYTPTPWNIENIVFGNNVSKYCGGAVFVSNKSNDLTFSNCLFFKNASIGFGGAVYFEYGFSKARAFDIKSSHFKSNYACNRGGSIYAGENAGPISLKLFDVSIVDSTANVGFLNGDGAAFVFAAGDGRLYLTDVVVLDSGDASHSSAVCFGDRASCTISGLVYFDSSSALAPIGHLNTFFIDSSLDASSRIPVQVGSGVLSDSNPFVALASGLGSDALKSLVSCFVPVDALNKIWFDDLTGQIVIGASDFGQIDVGGIKLEYYGYVNKVNLTRDSNTGYRIELLDFSSAGSTSAGSMKQNSYNGNSAGMLPVPAKAASTYPVRYVFFDGNGVREHTKRLSRRDELTELYRASELDFSANNSKSISVDLNNRFSESDSEYKLVEIWVSNPELLPDTNLTDMRNWTVFEYRDGLYFTLDASVAESDDNVILLRSEEQVVRYVAKAIEGTKDVRAAFFDYDVTSGKMYDNQSCTESSLITKAEAYERVASGSNVYLNTKRQGVNSFSSDAKYLFGFGNNNLPTELGSVKGPHGEYMNQGTSSFYKCAFGLVTGLGSDGKIDWTSGIGVPDLFGTSDSEYWKTGFGNSSLRFVREGNVFTLQSVVGPDGSPQTVNQDLRDFSMFTGWAPNGQPRPVRWTNLFWPMDAAFTSDAEGHDPVFGAGDDRTMYYYAHGKKLPSTDKIEYYDSNGVLQTLPNSDHNPYFGMSSTLEFLLSDEYVGPLEFYFFGDDDLFVFLDGTLVCDLGGVHQSAGAYVDLRDYLPVKSDEELAETGVSETSHKLDIRYLERGASGSACWMQFQLPTPLRVITDVPDTGNTVGDVEIVKNVSGIQDVDMTFDINIALDAPSGVALSNSYPVRITHPDGTVESGNIDISDNITLSMKPGVRYLIQNLPVGTQVRLSEPNMPGANWHLDTENSVLSGTIGVEKLFLNVDNIYQTGELRVVKRVVDGNNHITACNDNFYFNIELTDVNGNPLSPDFKAFYEIYDMNADPDSSDSLTSGELHTGMNAGIVIPGNHVLIVKNLEQEIKYNITEHAGELEKSNYGQVSADNVSNLVRPGEIQEAVVTNATLGDLAQLPSTGGVGNYRYIISGAACLCLVFLNLNKKTRASRKAV